MGKTQYEQIREEVHKKYKAEILALKEENAKLRKIIAEQDKELKDLRKENQELQSKIDAPNELLARFNEVSNILGIYR